ncbi:hypothetical protein SELMODRAFT_418027 [Selaginella moellendorffii]|uniref:Uncharacterized protein n=1 Tax=Selaginella moellendorffii TaxID=88036 RepID=D8S4F2_SELML|nr:hypothetical protein SELMODRAFT_418027 [Selaginella moellendorffii]
MEYFMLAQPLLCDLNDHSSRRKCLKVLYLSQRKIINNTSIFSNIIHLSEFSMPFLRAPSECQSSFSCNFPSASRNSGNLLKQDEFNYYNPYCSVITYFRAVDGSLRQGESVKFMASERWGIFAQSLMQGNSNGFLWPLSLMQISVLGKLQLNDAADFLAFCTWK